MQKPSAVIVFERVDAIQNVLSCLISRSVNFKAIVADGVENRCVKIDRAVVRVYPVAQISEIIAEDKDLFWFIAAGYEARKIKKFLEYSGVNASNVINIDFFTDFRRAWIGNVRYVEKYPIDFFATGISYVERGLDVNCFLGLRGANLACSNADLRQNYYTAKYVFEHTPGKIKFVLIGLVPYSLCYDNRKTFSVALRNLQFWWTLRNFENDTPHVELIDAILNEKVKQYIDGTIVDSADLNNDKLKQLKEKSFCMSDAIGWEEKIKSLHRDCGEDTYRENVAFLEEYIKLCLANDAKPVAVTFPFAPVIHNLYDGETLARFRETVGYFESIYDFKFVDLFDMQLGYSFFADLDHLNIKGAKYASTALVRLLDDEGLF